MTDSIHRFLLENLDIRGAFVRLESAWQGMQDGRAYPACVAKLLGEMTATATLIGGNLKQAGRLTFQLSGHGPLKALIVDCTQDLDIRGMARFDPEITEAPLPQMIGDGRLVLTLDLPTARQPYQSFVPLVGNSIADVFEHYLLQSEQQPARFFLAASEKGVAGLFLQKLPTADTRDADGWSRIEQLASTVKQAELLTLPVEELLTRLFHEEDVRLYESRPVEYCCPEDWEKVRGMLKQLGRDEAEAILSEHGEIMIHDDICNRNYRFTAADVAALFDDATPPKPTLH